MTRASRAAQPPLHRKPAPRDGMSSYLNNKTNGRWYLFGGEDASGYSDSLLALVRSRQDVGARWEWERWMKSGSPTRPSGRSRHTAAGSGDSVMYVFGGRNAGGVLGELWRFSGSFTDTSWV